MTTPEISVIVPVYKAETTIRKCLDSLLAQSFRDFEIILVDDGSPDRSGEICDEYAQLDSRLKVMHKPNGGVSSARQYGIDHALGEYTIHADPDDWVEPRMLEALYNKARETKADMVICDYYINENQYIKQKPTSLNHEMVLKEIFLHLHGSCWNKLIKRTCYSMPKVEFPQHIFYCEDQYVMAAILRYDIKIAYLSQAFYHYNKSHGLQGLSRRYDKNTYQVDLEIREMFKELLKDFPEQQQVALQSKTRSIVYRAFTLGRQCFSNKMFQKEFGFYAEKMHLSSKDPLLKWLIYYSCKGHFHLCNHIYWMGSRLNRIRKTAFH